MSHEDLTEKLEELEKRYNKRFKDIYAVAQYTGTDTQQIGRTSFPMDPSIYLFQYTANMLPC